MSLSGHGRYDYVPITKRPDFNWPDGKRLAVYLAINHEHLLSGRGLAQSWLRADRNPTYLITHGGTTAIGSALGDFWSCWMR